MTGKQHAADAAKSHSNLNAYAAVVAIMEGGMIHGESSAADEIIAICKRQMQVELRDYDKAIRKIK